MWRQFVDILRSHTKEQSKLLQRFIAGEDWDINDSFINLALLLSQKTKQNEEGDKEKNKNLGESEIEWHDLRVSEAEKVYENKQALRYEELFKSIEADEKGRQRNKIWLVGAAGSGKTTLSQRIAYDWSVSQQQQREASVPPYFNWLIYMML